MEYYLAEDQRPVDRCLADVRTADIYIVVIAWRYGYIPDGGTRSITELEYGAAVEAHIPILAFVMSDDHPWPPRMMENPSKTREFREKLMRERIVGVFRGKDDLARQVTEALQSWSGSGIPVVDWEVYRQAVLDRYRWVRLSVIAGAQDKRSTRIPLAEVFVSQQLMPGRPEYDIAWNGIVSVRTVDALSTLGVERGQVLLGGPGSGKSTLFHAAMLALCDPATSSDDLPEGLRDAPVPLMIELRQYVLSGCANFLSYLEKAALDTLGVRLDEGSIVELLLAGGALVLFDGLDDVFDQSVRARVLDQFRLFTSRYSRSRFLVSSRIVGYDDTELGLAGFEHYTILDFGLREIGRFVPRWYAHYAVERDDRDPAGLMHQIADNPRLLELAGNPLLLTMMAIIYKNQDLPEKRWQLYSRCTAVLLEDWDVKRKKIDAKESLKLNFVIGADQKAEILHRVATLMLEGNSDLRELNAIRYEPLREEIATYLKVEYGRPPGEARALAAEILNHLRERTYILAETGDRVFGFVHRTFMEFFAAGQVLAEFNRRKADYRWLKDEVYLDYWDDDRWREPLLLLSGMLAGQGSPVREIVEVLVRGPGSLVFAAQCLSEIGHVSSADRSWAVPVLTSLMENIERHVSKRRLDEVQVEEKIATFGRLASFVPVSEEIRSEIRRLSASRHDNRRVAAWQLDIAFRSRVERRAAALGSLRSPDTAVSKAAISVLEREWPGDEDILDAFVEILIGDWRIDVREWMLIALGRSWPRRRRVLRALSWTSVGTKPPHSTWMVNYLAAAWSGDDQARELVLQLAENHPWQSEQPLRDAVLRALVRGWGDQPDIRQFLVESIEVAVDESVKGVAACTLVEIDTLFAFQWLSSADSGHLSAVLPYIGGGFPQNVEVVEWVLSIAARGADVIRTLAVSVLRDMVLAVPSTRGQLREFARLHVDEGVRVVAGEVAKEW